MRQKGGLENVHEATTRSSGRKVLRLREYDYSQPGAYFITICTQNRMELFGSIEQGEMQLNERGRVVQECWQNLVNHYDEIELDAFVIMPDHVHGIIIIKTVAVGAIHELPRQAKTRTRVERRRMLLPKIIGRFKMNSAKQINTMMNRSGHPLWQRNYYEHIIRNERALNNIRRYIISNPMLWETRRADRIAPICDPVFAVAQKDSEDCFHR